MSLCAINSCQPENFIFNSNAFKNLDEARRIAFLGRQSVKEIYTFLHESFQKNVLSLAFYNAMASFLCNKGLSSLTLEQLIEITKIYVKADSTHLILSELFYIFEQCDNMPLQDIINLLVICNKLEISELKQPPNQVLVSFLKKLKAKMFNLLKDNDSFILKMQNELKNYDEKTQVAVLDALVNFGKINEKTHIPRNCYELVQSKYLKKYNYNVNIYLNIHKLQTLRLGKIYFSKDNSLKEDDFYQLNTTKIQLLVNHVQLDKIADLVKCSHKARLRNLSLFRTLAKRVIKQGEEIPFVPDQMNLIIKIFEGYANLNINNPLLFNFCYRKVVGEKKTFDSANALHFLYGTAIHGITGSPTSQVKEIIFAISPNIKEVSLTPVQIKTQLELMKLFVRAYFPQPQTFCWQNFETLQSSKSKEKGSISAMQKKASNFLQLNGINHLCEDFIPDYPFPLDIIILKDNNPEIKSNTIIEIDGPHHRDRMSNTFLGKDILKNYLLSQKWKIIRLDASGSKIKKSTLENLIKVIVPQK